MKKILVEGELAVKAGLKAGPDKTVKIMSAAAGLRLHERPNSVILESSIKEKMRAGV